MLRLDRLHRGYSIGCCILIGDVAKRPISSWKNYISDSYLKPCHTCTDTIFLTLNNTINAPGPAAGWVKSCGKEMAAETVATTLQVAFLPMSDAFR